MSPRPRETSDEEIVAAAARAMQRHPPGQLTLAHVAKEAGVVPATLIQRFGTKRGLLLAVCRAAPASVPPQFAAARAKYKSALKTLVELYVACSAFASTPESMANGLAYLQNDLSDPEFRAVTLAQFKVLQAETRKLLDEAVAERELVECDTAELARLIQQVNGGSMLHWAVFREGSLAAWLRRDLEALLGPYRRSLKDSAGNRRRRKKLC
ncbi:MAG TPA: helix-turn-helix domain-containing protein [Candidatus Acidoferrum sp.]|jgi:AcrR family transcriptional regulator|nr:helix-turn-helix domain-containing protein [Candidatus Acidoferrum sp.]